MLTNKFIVAVVAISPIALISACTETATQLPATGIATQLPEVPNIRSGSAEDEAICRQAVINQTQNSDAVVLSSQFSQANTEVIIGLGPQRARWRCLISNGIVADIMSLTNEGAL